MKASIVVGLGFGDEGKGITTDHLCSQTSGSLVIRFSGGQQAGHTVMTGGKKHVHSSFGSGTLRGTPSFFSEHTTIYPNTMQVEKEVLEANGITPKLYVHPLANLTTPYDIAWNRVTEQRNGHGSCGLGISATMKRNLESPCKIFAVDYLHPRILEMKLRALRNYYMQIVPYTMTTDYIEIAERELVNFCSLAAQAKLPFEVKDYRIMDEYEDWIFEGSQGILLDASHGIFPNVTYANTTSKNAFEILNKFPRRVTEMYYVTRCYQTRHGAGWMSNQDPIILQNNQEEINVHNNWQKEFKTGELDYDLLDFALTVDQAYSCKEPWTNHNLVVTCLDQRPDFNFEVEKLNAKGHYFKHLYGSYSPITNLERIGVVRA